MAEKLSKSLIQWVSQPVAIALLLATVATYGWIAKRFHQRNASKTLLPLPPGGEFLWGHERIVYVNEPGVSYRRWISQLGLTFRIKAAFWARDIVVLSDRAGIQHILSKNIYDYPHSNVVRPRIARFLGKGLGWVEGASEHRRMKRIVAPSLTAENIRDMSLDIRDAASKVINDLDNEIASSLQYRVSINILEWAGKMTLNAIGRVAFLLDFEGGKSEGAAKILEAKAPHSRPAVTFGGFLTLMMLRRFEFMNYLPIPALRAQGRVREAINDGVLEEIVKRSKGMSTDGKDLLSRLLKADLPRDELYAQISTFIISGHETTALTLSYTIYELARHPEYQQRLRQELQAFSEEPTYDDYQTHLPFLDAVLKETLRLYPALPYMERTATKDDVIPLQRPIKTADGELITNVIVHAGQTIIIPIIAIQRMDAVWEDPDTFRPDRWFEELPSSEGLPSAWSNLLAFSDGPRTCIGIRLGEHYFRALVKEAGDHADRGFQAIYNYKAMLSSLVKRFKFSDTGAGISLKIASAIHPWVVGEEALGPHLPVHVEAL